MFNAKKVTQDCIQWIRDWFDINGQGCNAVVGISGGKDSSIVAALCVEALGKNRVVGVLMPNHEQSDIASAYQLVLHLGIAHTVIDVGGAIDYISQYVDSGVSVMSKKMDKDLKMSEQARVNLPCRIRMATLYAVSQSVNGRVANTCNLSEDWIGYSTRYGDSVGDFSPLSDLTVTEVRAIGHTLGLPAHLVDKVPTDGLCGKTDEDHFGFTYEVLDKYIRAREIDDEDTQNRIDELHRKNLFKLQLMPKFKYKGW